MTHRHANSVDDAAKPPNRRSQFSLLQKIVFAIRIYVVGAPKIWFLEKLGLAERKLISMAARRHERMSHEKSAFGDYVAAKHDVFVVAFPKSGQNWAMQIVYQLAWHGNGEFSHILDVVSWPDGAPGISTPLADSSSWMAAPEKIRVIKTHLDWHSIPYSSDARYIIIIRDPKEAFVSDYYALKNGPFGPMIPSLSTMLKVFLAERGSRSWAAVTAEYWKQRHMENILVLSYKSMKEDNSKAVRLIATFLNVSLSEDAMARVIYKSSLEHMKSIDDKFNTKQLLPFGGGEKMIRKGLVGNTSELLTPIQQRTIDNAFNRELKELNSDFPYADFCNALPNSEHAPLQ